MKKKKNNLAEEFLRDYSRVIMEAQAAKFSRFLDGADTDVNGPDEETERRMMQPSEGENAGK